MRDFSTKHGLALQCVNISGMFSFALNSRLFFVVVFFFIIIIFLFLFLLVFCSGWGFGFFFRPFFILGGGGGGGGVEEKKGFPLFSLRKKSNDSNTNKYERMNGKVDK